MSYVQLKRFQQILLSLQIQLKIRRIQAMPMAKTQRSQIKQKYSKHEIVWAKITGFPWWPASITCTPSKSNSCYKVDFIGDRSYAYLAELKIADYAQFRHQYEVGKINSKNFTNALMIASRRHEQWLMKKVVVIKSKGSAECNTSYQKQQLNKQIQLPQIEENLQQIDSENQNHKNFNHKNSKQQQILKLLFSQKFFEENALKQLPFVNEAEQNGFQENQAVDMDESIQEQNREKLIEQILVKYKLNCIPILKQVSKNQKQSNLCEKKRSHWKKKGIIKSKQTNKSESTKSLTESQLITRKIVKFLTGKIPQRTHRIQISLSLSEQIAIQKDQRRQCFKKVMDWIQRSDPQNIINFHSQWVNFYKDNERQRQKHSNITMEDQSQQLVIK